MRVGGVGCLVLVAGDGKPAIWRQSSTTRGARPARPGRATERTLNAGKSFAKNLAYSEVWTISMRSRRSIATYAARGRGWGRKGPSGMARRPATRAVAVRGAEEQVGQRRRGSQRSTRRRAAVEAITWRWGASQCMVAGYLAQWRQRQRWRWPATWRLSPRGDWASFFAVTSKFITMLLAGCRGLSGPGRRGFTAVGSPWPMSATSLVPPPPKTPLLERAKSRSRSCSIAIREISPTLARFYPSATSSAAQPPTVPTQLTT